MVKVDLKGIAKVKAKGHTYYYAWRGGPRLRGELGSPEFITSYNEAIADRRTHDTSRFRSLVTLYKASADYKALADTTRKNWGPWLDRIAEHFGDLQIAQFDRPEKIRPTIRKWRNKWADKPRTADYGLQVLGRVLSYAVDPLGKIAGNPCEGVKRLYSVDRSEIIWTESDIVQIKKVCPPEIAHAVDLAAHTGLRLSDLLRRLRRGSTKGAIVFATGKSRGRREAIIPLYDTLKGVLQTIPRRSTTILTNSRHRPWTLNGFETGFIRAKARAGVEGLRFHDLRGTAATNFYLADIGKREIAEIMAWEEDTVDRIIKRYVGRSAATKALIVKLNQAGRRT